MFPVLSFQAIILEQRTQADALVKEIVSLDDAKATLESQLSMVEAMRDDGTATLKTTLEELCVVLLLSFSITIL